MLTYERQEAILKLLEQQKIAKLSELTSATGASESTIRRDLSELEKQNRIKRIHGGASLPSRKSEEPDMQTKRQVFTKAKDQIGRLAAGRIADGDSVFIDAGTSTEAMISHIQSKDVTIVTNGLNIIEASIRAGFRTYVLGGYVKSGTHAFVGRAAVEAMKQYRFDKAFIGTNGVDLEFGYSTPDPEEANIKQLAIREAQQAFVLADASKLNQTSFSRFAELQEAELITEETDSLEKFLHQLMDYTRVKAVRL
ncbi:DeoR/GlpR family DNA-binding transcription regulator [Alkalicoccus urumqiensis]|uniref:DeoR family transcriptional regulator n=1 Tax=Alkalicoccus urumqiensis TaxID=1548213 RepID=A0A2P6MI22_ALKUR|nr:DeoR/GlpR family DNA-binding transcription regulator [Alkalicoccus urumqiensis]PRO65935.1 DeoR family transcriptional regulator [Alkalicoccus urumqiensis]